ncbi:hypothetical protein GDO78_018061 [Eleutherodactylus coqui]|uniref:Cystatin domain-containing protein n=1 Tax=Eleutherodactylus coqui TaxID=57060 RepID=A0A8J6JR72_ELECQ|nr:hypothetical protein GDO78_018061 [Eleutherodactylus coqui]
MAAAWSWGVLLFLAVSASAGAMTDVQKGTAAPGFPRNVSTNDPEVKKAVVKGIKYLLTVELAETVCRKNTEYILDDCDFQKGRLKMVVTCYSEVWKISWLNVEKVTVLKCS